jgi:hypothetical protein
MSGGNVTDVASNAERRIDVKKRAAYIRKQEHTHLGMRRRIYLKVRRELITRQ